MKSSIVLIVLMLIMFLLLAFQCVRFVLPGQDMSQVWGQNKKLPEGQTCSNTFDTDADHKCACMTDMKCPMKKPEPCYDEEGDCPQPDNGPDSTKCISPNCKKDACKCANPCKS